MIMTNDKDAYCLAVTYNLLPPLPVYPARNRATNSGKYEPAYETGEDERCMTLAHFSGATNILVKYNQSELTIYT